MQMSRRNFIVGTTAGAAAVGLGLYSLKAKKVGKAFRITKDNLDTFMNS